MNLTQLKKVIESNGGATLSSNLNNAAINSGYMVSLAGYEIKTSIATLSSDMLEEYQSIAQQQNAYIGLWLDDNDLYLDVSINIQDKKQALKMARDNKQLAIYNVSTSESIYI